MDERLSHKGPDGIDRRRDHHHPSRRLNSREKTSKTDIIVMAVGENEKILPSLCL